MLTKFLPSMPLRRFVSHYWSSPDNPDSTHTVLPDGAVDLVIRTCGTSAVISVYGTTTMRKEVAVEPGNHYLGVCFRPGQSRHFLKAAAVELTDACEPAQGLLEFRLDDVPERLRGGNPFSRLDGVLERQVTAAQPRFAGIDGVIALIEASHGATRIDEAAALFGKSRRQFERVFLETVGVSAKFFSLISRFRYACALMAHSATSLADIAAESGYSDQSHMSHEFKRLACMSPATLARSDVAFLQDQPARRTDTPSPTS